MITVLFIAMSGPDGGEKVYAAGGTKKFSLKQAQQLAIANSSAYKKVLNKIELQEIKYAAAVKSIKMKKKNMSTVNHCLCDISNLRNARLVTSRYSISRR